MSVAPMRSELPVLFGDIDSNPKASNVIWEHEQKHMMALDVPSLLRIQMGHAKIYCNRAMAVPLRQALDNIVERGLAAQVKSFDGCFCIRRARGDALRLSVHSWGMAIDINAATNQLGTRGNMTTELAACFLDEGFIWGGEWAHRPDPMHFQYVQED